MRTFKIALILGLIAATTPVLAGKHCKDGRQAATVAASPAAIGAAVAATGAAKQDIIDTAMGADGMTTLVAAVKAAGLVETLKGKGPFTVFAPTDDAFAKLPKGTVEMLLKPENKKKLVEILMYHVVPGKVTAAEVMTMTEAKTAQGQSAKITVADGKVMVDKATVVKADVDTANGVIHVIDTVIMPKE